MFFKSLVQKVREQSLLRLSGGLRNFENQGVPPKRDDRFQNKRNAVIGLYGQTLIISL